MKVLGPLTIRLHRKCSEVDKSRLPISTLHHPIHLILRAKP